MARTIIFHKPARLFAENFSNKDEKVYTKFQSFEAQKPIQVESLYQCPSNKSYDFNLNGYRFCEVSPELLEVIS